MRKEINMWINYLKQFYNDLPSPVHVLSLEDRTSSLLEKYDGFTTLFIYSQKNPDTAVRRPLLIDYDNPVTKKMNNSVTQLKRSMDFLPIEENIDELEIMLDQAMDDFIIANQNAIKARTTGLSENLMPNNMEYLRRILEKHMKMIVQSKEYSNFNEMFF